MYIYEKLQEQLQKYGTTQSLMSYFTIEELTLKHRILKGNKASGIDNVTKQKYDANLEDNLHKLVNRLKDNSYSPRPVLRCNIPKANGKIRALGIPSYEDKLVQKIMADILASIYELVFHECSYGYRPDRNCHKALRKLNQCISNKSTKFVIETDIKGFFDNVNHNKLIEMLQYIIKDRHFINYIKRFLKSGIVDKGKFINSDTGTPQGGLISPVLGNVYLHYALDNWFIEAIKPSFGNCELIRYCDDFVICCDSKVNANLILNMVKQRLTDYDLQLEPNKTRVIDIDCRKFGPSNFNFLGFEVIIENSRCSLITTLNKTIQKQQVIIDMISKFVNSYNEPLAYLISALNSVLLGLYQYYAISTNMSWVQDVYLFTLNELHRVLCSHTRPLLSHQELYRQLLAHPLIEPPELPLFHI